MILSPAAIEEINSFVVDLTKLSADGLADKYHELVAGYTAADNENEMTTLVTLATIIDLLGSLKFPLAWMDVRDSNGVRKAAA